MGGVVLWGGCGLQLLARMVTMPMQIKVTLLLDSWALFASQPSAPEDQPGLAGAKWKAKATTKALAQKPIKSNANVIQQTSSQGKIVAADAPKPAGGPSARGGKAGRPKRDLAKDYERDRDEFGNRGAKNQLF